MQQETIKEANRRKQLVDTEKLKLAAPRLQFTWIQTSLDWNERECVYSLVLPLREHDVRREDMFGNKVRNELHLTIGITNVTGGSFSPSNLDTPFRDGAHAYWDATLLKLPVYVVCQDNFIKL